MPFIAFTVGRLIKYTGYGNAAGLLAHRGLMTGRKAGQAAPDSSDSDSDTEEYRKAEKLYRNFIIIRELSLSHYFLAA